ncbi:LacI family DNA-binding transcriptional regulator, partial [uncultured Paenibacillus sp.]
MKKAEINSVEIARMAGVSRSTVSRVINNYANVPA